MVSLLYQDKTGYNWIYHRHWRGVTGHYVSGDLHTRQSFFALRGRWGTPVIWHLTVLMLPSEKSTVAPNIQGSWIPALSAAGAITPSTAFEITGGYEECPPFLLLLEVLNPLLMDRWSVKAKQATYSQFTVSWQWHLLCCWCCQVHLLTLCTPGPWPNLLSYYIPQCCVQVCATFAL